MLTQQILLQLIVILVVTQFCGYVSVRMGQQWVIGEILAGLALGPSLLGSTAPGIERFIFPSSVLPVLQTLGDIGLILYMFALGTRLDTHFILKQKHKAVLISVSGVLLPFVMGALLAFWLFPALAGLKATRISFMLLIGTAMAITAFPVLARFLSEKNMLGTPIGTLALTSAAFDDICAWCLLGMVIAIVRGNGLISVGVTFGLTLVFIAGMWCVVRRLLALAERYIHSKRTGIAFVVIALFISAYSTNAIGIHPIFGAFLLGIILPRKTAFIGFVQHIDLVNSVIFLPLYFVYSGLRTQIGLISVPWMWFVCLVLLIVACGGKILGGVGALRVMGETWRNAFSLGILMNTRGLVELIVLNTGLDLGVLSPSLFAMLVIMALVTTMMTAPLLRLVGYRM